ncbi:hypothetical protein Dshi_3880 (plasmid) [Dinoroseobacter shibae DFL 12 = DSM 16493]|uniref:Uncharacterized protein n=1 Tax=Dinoroseobacter shibae (strain DSM 16493 / NCIMB 14021 / DFL 12) TaxID=398580 RepID=A8LTP1_DINSH|nr:hypothetical protein [Dinoroseobacter shibae]ABV95608.1 hypothetical protein Dshi_3880 [Dinoroseobacter shibae DFL 12 = DSM 16493]URF48816.1 hypothetical protein M8008_19910 [Dinoroseobacter shibae]URF53128.1 hypothetical protein M8007_19935 [Dinoroseobacter shibae]
MKLDRLIRAEAEWWLRVENAKAGVVTGGVQLEADVAVGGGLKVSHFNIDPKKFGQWKDYGVGIELFPIPNFGVQAFPTFPASGVFINGRLLTTGIGLRFLGLPSWANDLISWITGFLTAPLLAIIRAVIARFRIRIMKYPKHFPGTGLEWTPNLNERLENVGPYLLLSGDPAFE